MSEEDEISMPNEIYNTNYFSRISKDDEKYDFPHEDLHRKMQLLSNV